jgi:hypothetical protein
MRLPWLLASNLRVRWFVGVAVGAIVLGFGTFGAERSINLVIKGGYWAMLVLTAFFVRRLYLMAREAWLARGDWTVREWLRWPTALIGICGGVLLAHEPYGFKILMDEAMLLGTSMSMHFEKVALVPMRGNDLHGAFQVLNGQLDKRPLFQPFLTSVIHDVSGYRPENVFVLNSILTFVLLALAWRLGRRLAGSAGGAAAVLMLTGLPLLAQNATGGGFELLNLVMILATLLLGMRFAARRDEGSLEALVLSGVLLAHTRYESVLFLLPLAALVLWVWWEGERVILGRLVVCAPLFLLPYALHHQVFSLRESSWELASRPGAEAPFSLAYWPDNAAHALAFFFNFNGSQSNSLVIAVLGFLAAPFFALWTIKTLRKPVAAPRGEVALAWFAVGFALHTALMLCYFWGKFDDPVIRRLSLPLNVALVIGVVVAVRELAGLLALRVAAGLAVVGLFAHSLPAMARHEYSMEYYVGRETAWRREFIAAHPERDYLVIDNNSIFWVAHLVSATPVLQATSHKENVIFHHRNRSFSAIYVFQRFEVNPDTGGLTVQPDDDLGPDYQLETVWQRRFSLLHVSRISRVVAVKDGPNQTAATPRGAETTKLSPAELEKARQKYFEAFIKKLP